MTFTLPFWMYKDRIRRISLGKDDLVLVVRANAPAFTNCEFRFIPATFSDAKPAAVTI